MSSPCPRVRLWLCCRVAGCRVAGCVFAACACSVFAVLAHTCGVCACTVCIMPVPAVCVSHAPCACTCSARLQSAPGRYMQCMCAVSAVFVVQALAQCMQALFVHSTYSCSVSVKHLWYFGDVSTVCTQRVLLCVQCMHYAHMHAVCSVSAAHTMFARSVYAMHSMLCTLHAAFARAGFMHCLQSACTLCLQSVHAVCSTCMRCTHMQCVHAVRMHPACHLHATCMCAHSMRALLAAHLPLKETPTLQPPTCHPGGLPPHVPEVGTALSPPPRGR